MRNELYKNKWVSLYEVVDPDNGVNGYVYSHETRCQGVIVAILPFRTNHHSLQFLLKEEVTPCWGLDPIISSLTGGYEGIDSAEDVIRELKEEAGYTITKRDLIFLGNSFASKSSDTVYYLYSCNLTDQEQEEATGDGSRIESESKTHWVGLEGVINCNDPQVSTMYVRLNKLLQS